MSQCCPVEIINFGNQTSTVVPWTADRKNKFGVDPSYEVLYFDEIANSFYTLANGPTSSGRYDGINLLITHGGPSTGFIRLG